MGSIEHQAAIQETSLKIEVTFFGYFSLDKDNMSRLPVPGSSEDSIAATTAHSNKLFAGEQQT